MKKHLDKIFLILGFIGTMMCTSFTIYSNINKFNSSLKKLKDKEDELEEDCDDEEEEFDEE